MTDRSKFEQMLECLLAEDQEQARELFHQIVVEKSREIYENILAEDFEGEEEGEEEVEENFGFAEAEDEVGGDATDDFIGDVEDDGEGEDEFGADDEFGGEEDGEGEGDIEDRVVDLEDALDDLRAEFEKLMSDEAGEEEHSDMDFGDEESEDEFGGEEETEESFMREYVEKVSAPKGGDDGANTKSVVAKKNDMGGTTANILKGGEAKGEGTKGGLAAPTTKEENFGNVNVPGGNAGKTAFKKREPGHGAEKKASGDNGDKGAGSPLNGVKSRAK